MAFVLSLTHGRAAAGERTQVPLEGTDLVVGSAPGCDWQLGESVAPRHCQFGFRGGQWLVVDLGGGTRLNGQPLAGPRPIADGDQVMLADCVVKVADAVPAAAAGAGGELLLAAAGLTRAQVAAADPELLAAAGRLLQLLVEGLVRQLADRARSKAELGAEATQFSFGAINPLKALPADRALAALLAGQSGTVPADRAVADAFADLEAHQAATLAGMQEALATTLERFSPSAIRDRAQDRGLLGRVLPGAREAALWQAYEREFDGMAKGSGENFVELFAAAFRRAYMQVSSAVRRPS
jgi:predicted component of type VI protein secretion system